MITAAHLRRMQVSISELLRFFVEVSLWVIALYLGKAYAGIVWTTAQSSLIDGNLTLTSLSRFNNRLIDGVRADVRIGTAGNMIMSTRQCPDRFGKSEIHRRCAYTNRRRGGMAS